MSFVQELVVTTSSISGVKGRGLSVTEAQVVLKARVFLASISLAIRGKDGLSGQENIIMVGHDMRDGS